MDAESLRLLRRLRLRRLRLRRLRLRRLRLRRLRLRRWRRLLCWPASCILTAMCSRVITSSVINKKHMDGEGKQHCTVIA